VKCCGKRDLQSTGKEEEEEANGRKRKTTKLGVGKKVIFKRLGKGRGPKKKEGKNEVGSSVSVSTFVKQ
jgi:hypothetical protein